MLIKFYKNPNIYKYWILKLVYNDHSNKIFNSINGFWCKVTVPMRTISKNQNSKKFETDGHVNKA